jgi:sulfide:quinone oxidoreductase
VVRTASGRLTSYDTLVIAAGACPHAVVDGALTLGMPGASARLVSLLVELDRDNVERIAFVVPPGVAWTLPIYELALLIATYAHEARAGVSLAVITVEPHPVEVLGPEAGRLARELLAKHGIRLHTRSVVTDYEDGYLRLEREGKVPVSAVVALPRLEGPRIPGLPATAEGFLPVDGLGRVQGMDAIYAAGNVTSFPIKQAALAAQQADAAATSIAVRAGAAVAHEAFDPVLGALTLNGGASRFLRRGPIAEPPVTEIADKVPWWPPAKLVARHLSSYLAERAAV